MINSNSDVNGGYETSHSSNQMNYSTKRARHEVEVGRCEKYKGVVPQQNGNWGAQIYAKHQRIWLGTFKSEIEAAMAYDSATIKLRSGESHRNFPWNNQTVQEPLFQSHYSLQIVLNMIRNGTYQSIFSTFLNTQNQSNVTNNGNLGVKGEEEFSCTKLFQKELTPSDVGKLNRLVIPKKHALTYFPCVCGNNVKNDEECNYDVEVAFYDKLMRLWKFRYCYWKSSQSYVFTRGWNRFVKDKKLNAKDTIVFYLCEPINFTKGGERQVFSMIDVIYNNDGDRILRHSIENKRDVDVKHILGKRLVYNEIDDDVDDQHDRDTIDLNVFHSTYINSPRGLRLFGVSIN